MLISFVALPLSLETSETLIFSCNVFLRGSGTLKEPLLLKQRKERATVGQYTSIVVSQHHIKHSTLHKYVAEHVSQRFLGAGRQLLYLHCYRRLKPLISRATLAR